MKVIHTELKNYNRRADNSLSFRLDSLIELTSKEVGDIDSYRGAIAILVLTDSLIGNEIDLDIDDLLKNLPEYDAIDNYKSPSRRYREVLWARLQEKLDRKPTKEEFTDYYNRKYEKVIGEEKAKFKDNLEEKYYERINSD